MEHLTCIELIMSMSHFCMEMFDIRHRVVCSGGSSPGFGPNLPHLCFPWPSLAWVGIISKVALLEPWREPSLLHSWGVAKRFFNEPICLLQSVFNKPWPYASKPDRWPLHPWMVSHQRPQCGCSWLKVTRKVTRTRRLIPLCARDLRCAQGTVARSEQR